MSGSADVHKAVATLWAGSGLDTLFKAYWAVADRTLYTSLNDGEAAPGTPFPYAVFEMEKPNLKERSSGVGNAKQQINDVPIRFTLHAKQSGASSGKERAAVVANEVLKVFGGHPTTVPQGLTLDNGSALIIQYQNDFGAREADAVHMWTVEYNIRTDVPVMV